MIFRILFYIFFVANILFCSQPSGLRNAGNTCYMNSSIQCLRNIEPLTKFLLEQKKTDYYKKKTILNDGKEVDSIAKKYIELLDEIEKTAESSVSPIEFCQVMWPAFKFPIGGQWDAGEFVFKLLDNLSDNDINATQKTQWYGYPFSNFTPKNFVGDLFRFGLTSTLCPIEKIKEESTCNNKLQGESLLIFQLNIITHDWKVLLSKDSNDKKVQQYLKESEDLDKLLTQYFSSEEIEYQKSIWQKKFSLSWTSEYIIIQLVRFITPTPGNIIKIDKPIKIKLEGLDLTNYFIPNYKPKAKVIYDLESIVQHAGSFEGGHYTAVIKKNKKWYVCDDSSTYEFNDINNLEKTGIAQDNFTPYLLFYKKRTTGISDNAKPKINETQLIANLEKLGVSAENIEAFTKNKKIKINDLVNGINQNFRSIQSLHQDILNYLEDVEIKEAKTKKMLDQFYTLNISLRTLS